MSRFDHPHGEDTSPDGLYGCSSARPLVKCARLAQYGADIVEVRKAVVRSFHPNNIRSLVISHHPKWMGKRPTGDLGKLIMAEAYNKELTPWEDCETTKGCEKKQLDCTPLAQ